MVHDRDTFIYEYIGDVVSHLSFMKRMREYAEEGMKHFGDISYFGEGTEERRRVLRICEPVPMCT